MNDAFVRYDLYDIIRSPIVTEKTTGFSEVSQVGFYVEKHATKQEIKKAVELIFEKKVLAVNTLIQKGKQKKFRGKMGRRSDFKKAYITLAPGNVIDIASGV